MVDKLTKLFLSLAALAAALSLLAPRAFAEPAPLTPAVTPAAPAPAMECFAAKLWQADAPTVNAGQLPKLLKVPAGWLVVGGTTANFGEMAQPAAVLCRPVEASSSSSRPPLSPSPFH